MQVMPKYCTLKLYVKDLIDAIDDFGDRSFKHQDKLSVFNDINKQYPYIEPERYIIAWNHF